MRIYQSAPGSDDQDNVDSSTLSNFFALMRPWPNLKVDRMSATDLAYIGDVVFEQFVRNKMVWPPKRTSDLQNQVVAIVRAESQAQMLRQLRRDIALTTHEEQVLNRGRNGLSLIHI